MIPTPNHVIHDDSYIVIDEFRRIREEKRREWWQNVAGIAITTAILTAIAVLGAW